METSKINFFTKFFSVFLIPLSLGWEYTYRLRRFFYDYGFLKQNEKRVPIISVGNLTFGGTGKTPFTLWLSNYLNDKDKKVMILTRGYKGGLENKSGILNSGRKLGYNPFEYGDEPLMLVRRIKNGSVVVGKKRSENLEFYFPKELPDVVLLDDGHQHLKLARNLNIVLFDAIMPIERYKVAPMGYMREGFSALKDADAIIIGRCDQVDEKKIKSIKEIVLRYSDPNIPFALMKYNARKIYNTTGEKQIDISELRGMKVVSVTGIASPKSFQSTLEECGAKIVETYSFPDHHFFTAEEMNEIREVGRKEGALIITTEKDMVKMKRVIDDSNIYYLEITTEFVDGEKKLIELIDQAAMVC